MSLLDWQCLRLKSFICLHSGYNIKFLKLPHLFLLCVERLSADEHRHFILEVLRELLLDDSFLRQEKHLQRGLRQRDEFYGSQWVFSGGEEVLFVVGLVQTIRDADRSSQKVFPLELSFMIAIFDV